MHWLLMTAVVAQTHVFQWEDAHGEVHFTDDRGAIPQGAKALELELPARERNGLLPAPEPIRGPLARSEWRHRFAALRERRQQVFGSKALTSRECRNRAAEVTVAGSPAHQQQVSVRPCPTCEARWVWVQVAEEAPRKVSVMVQDCTQTLVAKAQAELTDALVSLRAEETALTEFANQYQVPDDWRH
jgi:hypothetical protein